ncbi:vascular-related unknown protein 1 isoform X2 [Dioscorea cayenensis subsp. rotundata]|uniref:Uncharacterized protein n=1 Tax=Dioscorea cayennensis subsp. rotundata TaxID=55577 RepID=A0AB40BYY1_DIOCR|nr:vascular-related unknown protein 1 isoform X2 [Dioscorea cayenensis subsp. rotundata]
MENSMSSSSMNRALFSKEAKSSEESGWTWYFEEDFMEKREEDDGNSSASFCLSSSMVSDAASYAAWKSSVPVDGVCQSLSFKKRKTIVNLDDDSLEDTASSPANSPKVSELSQRRNDDKKDDVSEEKHDVNGLDFIESTNEYTELQKRGLCLVPLSMFLNYI